MASFYDRFRELKSFQSSDLATKAARRNGEKTVLLREIDTSLGASASGDRAFGDQETAKERRKRLRNADEAAVEAMFSGEELLGKSLDLHSLHEIFVNAAFSGGSADATDRISYRDYVDTCFGSAEGMRRCVPMQQKLKGSSQAPGSGTTATGTYFEYISQVESYLIGFIERTQPLMDVRSRLRNTEEKCIQSWIEGKPEGWEDFFSDGAATGGALSAATLPRCPVDLDAFQSSDELLSGIGAESVTSALKEMGIKAGGTPLQRAERLYGLRGVTDVSALDPSIFASSGKNKKKKKKPAADKIAACEGAAGDAPSKGKSARKETLARQVAVLEAKICMMLSVPEIAQAVRATVTNVERKQALTYEEMQAEILAGELEDDADFESDDEDEAIYNPLKLPLGWDGKPIPYWLYKLHGLNQEFRCEICGDATYNGRRAFERHFSEQKHQAGLRALGIPPGKEFHEVTGIQDALDLYKSMQEKGFMSRKAGAKSAMADDEEFEDNEGNVYNRKTYEDLKRQGLL